MLDKGSKPRVDGEGRVRHLVDRRYPGALAAVLAGSAAAGRAGPGSDLDVVVLVPHDGPVLRETVAGPVELFVHTAASWQAFVHRETAARRSPLLHMCATGVLVADRDGTGAGVQAEARRRWDLGPTPLTRKESEDRRYALTDLIADLRGDPSPDELLAIGAQLVTAAAELALLHRRQWLGAGKWLLRRWQAADPHGCAAVTAGLRTLAATSDPDALVGAAAEVLDVAGGPVLVGYHREAPPALTVLPTSPTG